MELARRSLSEFIKQCWHIVEPGQEYLHGWHIDAISEHLEAVTNGEITRLLINVPPGMMKSLQVGVFWPAWEWGPKKLPHYRYVAASHEQSLSIRDNLRMRRLVESDWYKERYGDIVTITTDQNEKKHFENTATGFRQAVAAGAITGKRGDRVLIDDPFSVEDARSEVIIESRTQWFTEAIPTRLNNPTKSAIVVIMQRVTQKDTSGIIIERELGYEHLMLPMEFEPARKCFTSIGFEDPRKEDGELLFPQRFPREVVERDKAVMGPYAVAGQFQQRPVPRGGGLIKAEWLERHYIAANPPRMSYVIQSWDTAFKTKTQNDFSVCTTWGIGIDGGFYLLDRYKGKVEFPELKNIMFALWKKFNPATILIEDKASGQSLIQEMSRPIADPEDKTTGTNKQLYKLPIKPVKVDVDKIERVHACTTTIQTNVHLPDNAPWKQDYVDNLTAFPNGAHDDDVDSTSQALLELVLRRSRPVYSGNVSIMAR